MTEEDLPRSASCRQKNFFELAALDPSRKVRFNQFPGVLSHLQPQVPIVTEPLQGGGQPIEIALIDQIARFPITNGFWDP